MKNFKGLKRTLNKTMAMLTVCAVLISCVGVMSASATVANVSAGNYVPSIDTLWNAVKPTQGQFATAWGDYKNNYSGTYTTQNDGSLIRDGMGVGFENGVDGNVVVYSGNGTTALNGDKFSGTFGYRGWFHYTGALGASLKQKWEVKVKLSSENDKVYVFAYDRRRNNIYNDKHTKWVYDTTGNVTNTAVLFEGGKVKIADLNGVAAGTDYTYNTEIASGIEKNVWYKVVRYMDLTEETSHKSKTYVYKINADNTETLVSDPNVDWTIAGTETNGANMNVRFVGFDVESASAPVMFDDLAGYMWEAAPNAVISTDYKVVGGDKMVKEINELPIGTLSTDADDGGWYPDALNWSTHVRQGKIEVALDTDGNQVLKTTNGGSGTDYSGAITYRYLRSNGMDVAKYQKWEVKVKFASTSDEIYVLPYATDHWLHIEQYDSQSTPIKLKNGVATAYDGVAGSWKELCTGLVANQWYKVSTASDNRSRSQIYKVNSDGTETLLGDTISMLKSGTSYSGSDTWMLRSTGVDVISASAPVMIDDLFVYVAESYDLPTTNVSVDLGKVVVNFDTAMNKASFNKDAVTLSANGTNIPLKKDAEYDESTNAITVEFNTLQYDTDYTLTIAKNVMKASGGLGLTPDADAVYTFKTEADPFSISELAFKDAAGADLASVTALNKGATVKGCATLVNTSAKTRSYNLILAIYKGDEMTNLISKPGTIANTTEEGTPIETDALTIADDGSRAELFVWDSWEGLRPLTEKDVIPTPAA